MRLRFLLTSGILLALSAPANAVTIDWVTVGDPGNACDTQPQGCFGAVAYPYRISRTEVTNAQYAEFLNAKAASDPLWLYNPFAGSGILRSGSAGSYTYNPVAGREDMPVTAEVRFFSTFRFANWLHNGQGTGDTETGAYTLLGGSITPTNRMTVTRNAGAGIFLTSEDEWYKAAYYDALTSSYFDYPAGSDTRPTCTAPTPTPDTANCAGFFALGDFAPVGSYPNSASPYGTLDQGGNANEWNETILGSDLRGARGGWAGSFEGFAMMASARGASESNFADATIGFRVASVVPEPTTALLLATGLVGLAVRRRKLH